MGSNKIIFQIGPEGQGGVSAVINALIKSFLKDKYQFMHIKTLNGHGRLLPFIIAYVKCFKMRNKISIAHIHMGSKGSYLRKKMIIKLLYRNNVPIVLHLHGSKFREFYRNLPEKKQKDVRELFAKAMVVIMLTNDWIMFSDVLGIRNKTVIVPNFTSVPDLSSTQKINKNTGKCTVLFLGRLGKRKGSYDLIDVAVILKQKLKNHIEFILAGDGEVKKTKKYVERQGVQENIKVLGWIGAQEKDQLLRNASILVLPSYFESFGLALIEGMSYGLPVIGTTSDSIRNVVCNGQDGFLVKAGDILDLANKIQVLTEDSQLREQMGKSGREHVIRSYSEEHVCSVLDRIYKNLL